jgi:DNA-binding winged helix-turn-helix (wHTH) protein/TolB-like protein/tetratricopeptide (TPR) repeat protein
METDRYAFDRFVVDPVEQRVLRDGIPVPLEPKVFETLHVLIRNAGRLVDKAELMRSVWPEAIVEEGNLARNVSLLRKVLGTDAEGEPLIETVPKRGYRFVRPVAVLPTEARSAASRPPDGRAVPAGIEAVRLHYGLRRGTVLLGSLVLLGSTIMIVAMRVRLETGPRIESLAVLPFAGADDDPGVGHLALGINDGLAEGLAQLPELRVASRHAASRYAGRDIDPGVAGSELQVDAVLTGRVRVDRDAVEVAVELVDPRDHRFVWGKRYRSAREDLLVLQRQILEDVASRIRPRADTGFRDVVSGRIPANGDAYELFLKGRFHLAAPDYRGLLLGIEYLERSTRADPGYAPAWAALSFAYAEAGNFGTTFLIPPRQAMASARAAASRALELDPGLSEAQVALGQIAMSFEWDWDAAEKAFRTAITLDPEDASAHHRYSHLLIARSRDSESYERSVRAVAIDPLDVTMQIHLGYHHYMAGELDLATAQLERVLQRRPHAEAHNILAHVYERQGRYEEAVAELRKGEALGGIDLRGVLGYLLARAGRRDEARAVLAELLAESARREVSGYDLAKVHAGLGDGDEAFAWLRRAVEDRDPNLLLLAVDPHLESLRGDARFDDLLKRLRPLGHSGA